MTRLPFNSQVTEEDKQRWRADIVSSQRSDLETQVDELLAEVGEKDDDARAQIRDEIKSSISGWADRSIHEAIGRVTRSRPRERSTSRSPRDRSGGSGKGLGRDGMG